MAFSHREPILLQGYSVVSKLYHLAYISESTLGENEQFVRDELQQILEAAKVNNPTLSVTGALLYSGGYFCQLLEGPQGNLEQLFEKIMRDDRHARVEVLFFDPAPKRLFGIWAMAYAGFEVQARFDIRGVRSINQLNAEHMGQNMIETLESMVVERQKNLGQNAVLHV